MAIEQLFTKGAAELKEKDYLSAIATYTTALKEHPKSILAFLKRSTAYQKLNNYENAKRDVSNAFDIAEQKGKRSDLGACYFRLGLIYYAEKDYKVALKNFEKSVEFDCPEATVESWRNKCEYDLKKNPPAEDSGNEEGEAILNIESGKDKAKDIQGKPSTNIDVINSQAPLKVKIRDDWYQTNDSVIITIYAKNIKEQELQVNFKPNLVNVSFPSSATSEYNYNLEPLFAVIESEKSTFRIYSTKLEITLKKKESRKWPSLEASENIEEIKTSNSTEESPTKNSGLAYPTSSKKSINWSAFKINDDEDNEKSENEFFAQLYKDTDDDTRRAMMKSYVESNGTVLTTNWEEAQNKKYETSPPEGMVEKKWNDKG
ncbi:CS domain-containing protein [Debaryomyces fabryi]|uniref:CS domain-containing protein n=1 Tax=Debaryomyces fabryi TaxID=58627 RepID=A0A0V1PW74_9ASCO|nr:CS domain-containing protein [Debaryomyces fabryi]KSA00346.1 CS domain-containing protein [Debaryomyces fabryi]CUM49293.1 unnamed protein product [Debaryomyces fabryi]